MKLVLLGIVAVSATVLSTIEPSDERVSKVYRDLLDLSSTIDGERKVGCRKAAKPDECLTSLTNLYWDVVDGETLITEALLAEDAGDSARKRVVVAMLRKTIDGKSSEFKRLQSLHVP